MYLQRNKNLIGFLSGRILVFTGSVMENSENVKRLKKTHTGFANIRI